MALAVKHVTVIYNGFNLHSIKNTKVCWMENYDFVGVAKERLTRN
jgi:hypothetical protein